MAEILDCLVTYMSAKAHADGMPSKYICYHVVSGPGPVEGSGVASIGVVATTDASERHIDHLIHAAITGGPRAAIDLALHYVEAEHQGDSLERLQTEIRSTPCVKQREDANLHLELPRFPPADLSIRLTIGDAITVLDARAPSVWEASGVKIRGAMRVEPGHNPADPKWPKDHLTVVYGSDAHDGPAAAVAAQLHKLGYSRCEILSGGFKLWQQLKGAVEPK
jgi:rhodanese-related sulfurtransferase